MLLLGGTGYLGSHVLWELICRHEGRLFCFVRPGKEESGEQRLKATLRAYFGDDCAPLFGTRITVIEGDATDPDALRGFQAPSENMTAINCAASVKHFAKGNEIERANVDSVRNLAAWCERSGVRLVHISTCSVAGNRENDLPPESYCFDEHRLYAGQEIDSNQYVRSKFMAERYIYEEILERGLRAKVLRVANLAPRAEDGAFQINFRTNNFMNSIRAYQTLGMIQYDALITPTEFSPIDCVAKSVLALACTPDECVCFMLMNPHRPLMGDIIRELNAIGYPTRGAEDEEVAQALRGALSDEKTSEAVGCLIAYNSNGNIKQIGLEGFDNTYTTEDMVNHTPSFYHGDVLYFKPGQIPSGISEESRRYWEKMMEFEAGNYEHYCARDRLRIVHTPHEHDLMMDDASLNIIVPEIMQAIENRIPEAKK